MEQLKTNKNIYRITLLIIGLLMVLMSFNHGITGDEDDASAYGKAIISYMTTMGDDTTALHMPEHLDKDHILHLYGGAFDMMAAVVHKIVPFMDEFTLRHILNALMGFLAIFFASRIVLLFSNYRAATIVALLMFLFPFFLGHSMNNPKDVPFAAAYIMSIYFIIRFWRAYPDVKKKDYAFLILSLALALNIRIAAFLLFAYLGVWLLFSLMPNWKANLKKVTNLKTVLTFVGICVSAYVIAVLFWPYALQDPINNPFIALETFSNLNISLAQTWEGTRIPSAELPWYYAPKAILITSTYVFLLGLILALYFLFKNRKEKHFWLLLFVGFTGVFPVFYIVYKDSNIFHLWRHILFVFPSLAIMAAYGWEQLIAFGEKHKSAIIRWGTVGIFVILILQPAVFIARNQPNEVNYYNEFVGGPKEAYNNYEFDYYYNGLKPSVDYFIDNVAKKLSPSDTIMVTTNAWHLLKCYLADYPNVKVRYNRYHELNNTDWDYNILHKALVPQPKLNSGSWLPPKHTLYVNKMQDLALSAVIKRPSREDLKASKLLQEQKVPEAITALKNYLKEDPNNTNILKMLANALQQSNQLGEAYTLIKKVLDLEPDDIEAKQILGIISLQRNDPTTALNMFNQIIAANPQYIAGYYYLGNAQYALGQLNEALASYNVAAQVPQLSAACYKAMGDIYLKLGNQEQAQKLYNLIQQ